MAEVIYGFTGVDVVILSSWLVFCFAPDAAQMKLPDKQRWKSMEFERAKHIFAILAGAKVHCFAAKNAAPAEKKRASARRSGRGHTNNNTTTRV